MVRRLNIDGDGQGDLQATGESTARSSCTRLIRIGTGEKLRRSTFSLRAVRRELHRRRDVGRRSVHRRPLPHRLTRSWRSPSRGSPAIASASGCRASDARRCWSGTTARASTSGSSRRARSARATRSSGRRGPEAMTVAEIDGLLYLPHKARRDLERALRIPALSPGWQGSFRDLLEQAHDGAGQRGRLGGTAETAGRGARPRERERDLGAAVPADGKPATPAQPGQFLTVRLRPDPKAAPLLRTYSLSDLPNTKNYRISVKREPDGAASGYINTKLQVGDVIEAGVLRGSFVLRPGDGPVVLISAGVGATPVMAMLHVLAAERSTRPVWCLYSAHNGAQHPFAKEAGRPPRAATRRAPRHLLQPPRATGSHARRLRHHRTADRRRHRAGGRPGRRRLLSVRAERVHARHLGRTDRARRRPGPGQRGGLRGRGRDHAGCRRRHEARSAPAGREAGPGPVGLVQPQQPHGCVGPSLRQPARARFHHWLRWSPRSLPIIVMPRYRSAQRLEEKSSADR